MCPFHVHRVSYRRPPGTANLLAVRRRQAMETWAEGKSNEAASLIRLSNCISSGANEHKYMVNLYSTLLCRVVPNLEHSTRHSVTSRIDPNSSLLSYLTFSTRHLNATPEKRTNVEKFNTWHSLFCRSERIRHSRNRRAFYAAQKSQRALAHHPGRTTFGCGSSSRSLRCWLMRNVAANRSPNFEADGASLY
jgi:hypothetical protein